MNSKAGNQLDGFAVFLARWMIRLRWLVIIACLAGAGAIGQNAAKLEYSNNYRAFFSKENPELKAFEAFQGTYAKNDNLFFVLEPRGGGGAFTNETLAAVERLTEMGWQTPYALRVDSVTNFQHTYAIGDELIVEDLIIDARSLTQQELAAKREIALAEPLLREQLVTPDGGVTAVNVVLQFPERSLDEVPEAANAARFKADAGPAAR